MASGKVIVPSKAITKKKEKANKKLTWTDQDTDVFAEVIYDPQYRGSDYTVGWATVLERLALKKSSNVKIFEEIQEALRKEFEARKMKVKEFTVEQLRSKYKWFKREWKYIQNKIKFGSGLSSKETECTRWYDTLNPVFTEGVDEFTDVACSAGQDCKRVESCMEPGAPTPAHKKRLLCPISPILVTEYLFLKLKKFFSS